ncbi:TNF10 factor, partial [Polypterus senegalus]
MRQQTLLHINFTYFDPYHHIEAASAKLQQAYIVSPRSKEILKEIRKNVVDIYQFAKGYKGKLNVEPPDFHKIKGRTIRVDHVANYRPPKDSEDIDEVTKQIREEGCAPKTPPVSSSESEEEYEVSVKKQKKDFPYFKQADGRDVILWENSEELTFQQGLMDYRDGEIIVLRDGLYFIYSQIYFWTTPQVKEFQQQPFLQYVYRKTSYQDPVLLSKAVVTKCWHEAAEFDLFSSYQGALFELTQGDRIFLKVTDVTAVSLNEESTYFGAFIVY